MPRGHDDLLLAPTAPVTLEHTQSSRDEPLPQATRYLHPKFLKAHAEFRDLAGQLSANRPGFVPRTWRGSAAAHSARRRTSPRRAS